MPARRTNRASMPFQTLAGGTWLACGMMKVAAYGEVVWSWHSRAVTVLARTILQNPGAVCREKAELRLQ
jgi:hypothetical protein